MRAAVHHLRLHSIPSHLGALRLSHAAILTLHRIAPSARAAALPLAAGPAETTLPPSDRVDLALSLRAHLFLAALDLLAHHIPPTTPTAHSTAAVDLLHVLLLPSPSSSSPPPQTPLPPSPLTAIFNHTRPAPVLAALLDHVAAASAHVNISSHLHLLSISSPSRTSSPSSRKPAWHSFDLFSIAPPTPSAIRSGLIDTVTALSSATSRLRIRRASIDPVETSDSVIHTDSHLPIDHRPATTERVPSTALVTSAENALAVLAQLCAHTDPTFRSALHALRDGGWEQSSTATTSTGTKEGIAERGDGGNGNGNGDDAVYPFGRLYDMLGHWLAHPQGALLGYILLVGNKGFRTFALARTDPDTILMPLLASLRQRCVIGSVPADAYVPATILLALTSDRGFCEAIDAISVPEHWLGLIEDRTRLGTDMLAVSGAVLLVCARVVHQSLIMRRKRAESFLCRVCLGIMGNIASDATNVHPLVAERLVSLVEFLGRRRKRAVLLEKRDGGEKGRNGTMIEGERNGGEVRHETDERTEDDSKGKPLDQMVETLSELVGMGLEVIVGVLRARSTVAVNRHLVYTLMHREGVLESQHVRDSSVKSQALVHMLKRVLQFFSAFVEECEEHSGGLRALQHGPGVSVERVFEVIEDNARLLPGDVFEGVPPMAFAFQEVESTDKFVWSYVLSLARRMARLAADARVVSEEKVMDLPAGFSVYQLSR